jgi:hypothetical protein
MNTININAPRDIVRNVFLNPDIILRLNPSWYIKKITTIDKGLYAVTLYDDRTDDTSEVHLKVEEFEKSVNYIMNSDTIEFLLNQATTAGTVVSVKGGFFREADLQYWMKGLKNYIRLEATQSRIAKWFLDKCWLRMTPSQRRISIIIILAEGIGLAALIAVVIALQLMK